MIAFSIPVVFKTGIVGYIVQSGVVGNKNNILERSLRTLKC